MIDCSEFYSLLKANNVSFFTGVPDSLLKDFCAYVSDHTDSKDHIIAANEGAAVGLAVGYHLATGKIPLVYMQNSGLGNTINPLMSLADKEVYSIPMILMIGWRGEPGVKDEPQHIKQGRIQNDLLDAIETPYKILNSSVDNPEAFLADVLKMVDQEQAPVAIVVKKGSFAPYTLIKSENFGFELTREKAIEIILESLPEDALVVSTTGKTSREVFEYRVRNKQLHNRDFLTVGSMGHCSQIAFGIALNTKKTVVCLDGDGAAIMHLGSLAIIGQNTPKNFVHIILNNGAHDSVGGQPTTGLDLNFPAIAEACGYKHAKSIATKGELQEVSNNTMQLSGPVFLEVKVNKGARKDLGRPTSTPIENKQALMQEIQKAK